MRKLVNRESKPQSVFYLMLKKDKAIREICTLAREKKLCYDLVTKRKNLRKFLLFADTDFKRSRTLGRTNGTEGHLDGAIFVAAADEENQNPKDPIENLNWLESQKQCE